MPLVTSGGVAGGGEAWKMGLDTLKNHWGLTQDQAIGLTKNDIADRFAKMGHSLSPQDLEALYGGGKIDLPASLFTGPPTPRGAIVDPGFWGNSNMELNMGFNPGLDRSLPVVRNQPGGNPYQGLNMGQNPALIRGGESDYLPFNVGFLNRGESGGIRNQLPIAGPGPSPVEGLFDQGFFVGGNTPTPLPNEIFTGRGESGGGLRNQLPIMSPGGGPSSGGMNMSSFATMLPWQANRPINPYQGLNMGQNPALIRGGESDYLPFNVGFLNRGESGGIRNQPGAGGVQLPNEGLLGRGEGGGLPNKSPTPTTTPPSGTTLPTPGNNFDFGGMFGEGAFRFEAPQFAAPTYQAPTYQGPNFSNMFGEGAFKFDPRLTLAPTIEGPRFDSGAFDFGNMFGSGSLSPTISPTFNAPDYSASMGDFRPFEGFRPFGDDPLRGIGEGFGTGLAGFRPFGDDPFAPLGEGLAGFRPFGEDPFRGIGEGLADFKPFEGFSPFAGTNFEFKPFGENPAASFNPYAGLNLDLSPDYDPIAKVLGQFAPRTAIDRFTDLKGAILPNLGNLDDETKQLITNELLNAATGVDINRLIQRPDPTLDTLKTKIDEMVKGLDGGVPGEDVVEQFTAPENPLMPGVVQGQRSLLDFLSGNAPLPYLADLMASQDDEQAQELQDLEQTLAVRGVANSTPADEARQRLKRSQRAEDAHLSMGAFNQVVPTSANVYRDLFGQNLTTRNQALDEFFRFLQTNQGLDSQRQAQTNQALALMLNALGMSTINPQMPSFSLPDRPPGAGAAIGNIGGNILTAMLSNPNFGF